MALSQIVISGNSTFLVRTAEKFPSHDGNFFFAPKSSTVPSALCPPDVRNVYLCKNVSGFVYLCISDILHYLTKDLLIF